MSVVVPQSPEKSCATGAAPRHAGAFATPRARRRYWLLLIGIALLGVAFTALYFVWNIPVTVGSEGFWIITRMRAEAVFSILLVAFCQSLATLAFQTVTTNRILTPSIMGFESLYSVIHTSTIFFFGVAGFVAFTGVRAFLIQVAIMVACALALYGWLLRGKLGSLHIMLLIGIIIGTGLGSLSAFMQRMLTPSEFDVLSARMFGTIANARSDVFVAALPLALGAGLALLLISRSLNAIALGRDVAVSLGVNHLRMLLISLTLIAVLVSVSTALVGPMTFFGFLVATLTYQAADTYDHRFLFPMAAVIGYAVLMGGFFVMKNIFSAEGVVSIIIELVGGLTFLVVVLRKGRL